MVRWIARQYLIPFRDLPPSVWFVSLTVLINRSGTMVLPFLALYVTTELGLEISAAGYLLAMYGVGAILGNWIGGWLKGRFGPLLVQFASLAFAAGGFMLLSLAHGESEVAACLFLLSLVGEANRPAAATATTLLAPPHAITRAFALNRLAINLGMSIGTVLGGFLAEIGFKYLFYADAVTCLLAAVFLAATLGLSRLPDCETEDAPLADGLGSPWRDHQFLLVMFLLFIYALVFFQVLGTYVLYLEQQYHFSKPLIGAILAINTVLIVLVEMLVIHHTEQYSRLKLVACGCILIGLGFGLLPFGSGIVYCSVLVVIWTAGEILGSSPSLAYVTSRSTRANQSAYLAAYAMTMSAALVLAPVLGMSLYEQNPNWPWYASLGICTCIAAALYWIDSRRRALDLPTRIQVATLISPDCEIEATPVAIPALPPRV
ncbi:MFS transporter [Bythopirellula polymerisocia]|uniref:Multidrug resistance protein MdtH n=1 Tax=Bythopirellula polymerisocia TaxID=2528003 RepID=A0A5C6C9G1_9BACT|nr:MFS transporter [Bythopirellula polymerisocia]TWU20056.1 multidrug resistance protein MdtH [Bythopirellula polymerisocia]